MQEIIDKLDFIKMENCKRNHEKRKSYSLEENILKDM
jgi:hypothetical protein